MGKTSFLKKLRSSLGKQGAGSIYPCIEDLVENGLVLARFSPEERTPTRQDITQYLAAWCRHAHLEDKECGKWLVPYCAEVLSPLSRTSPSGIRHSTKSNIKYIYRSEVPFTCRGMENPFKARCEMECPRYAKVKMGDPRDRKPGSLPTPPVRPPRIVVPVPAFQVKENYKAQFDEALGCIRSERAKGTTLPDLVRLLNEREFKTRTGRKWTRSILAGELKKLGLSDTQQPTAAPVPVLNVKERYKAQFDEALGCIRSERAKGTTPPDLVRTLNERGFKTRTGRKWTISILAGELNELGLSDKQQRAVGQAPVLQVKEHYKAQFDEALGCIRSERARGTTIGDLVRVLSERGFKTRTGKKWTYSILRAELMRLEQSENLRPGQAGTK